MCKRSLTALTICCIASMLFLGCASSQPTRFFILSSMEPIRKGSEQPCSDEKVITVGVNPVNVPHYLDRPQIMTRVSDNEFRLSELNVWAEPLEDNLSRVMAQNLGDLPCTQVVMIPKASPRQLSHRLSVELMRLEGALGGQALLEAQWSITDETARRVLYSRTSKYTEPVRSNDYNALVSAYNRLIDALSRDVADSLMSISKGKDNQ